MRRPPHHPPHAPLHLTRDQVLTLGAWLELGLLALAALWAWQAPVDLRQALAFSPHVWWWALLGTVVMVASSGLLLLCAHFSRWQQPRWWLEELFVPLFRDLRLEDILLLSAAAGFCEEVFFRGVLQSVWGWLAACVAFGLAHFPGRRYWGLGVWAAVVGGWLSWVYQQTGSLWAPIMVHTVYDVAALAWIRFIAWPRLAEQSMQVEAPDEEQAEG